MNAEPKQLLQELLLTAPRLLEVCDEITNAANYKKEMSALYPALSNIASFMIELIIERMTIYRERIKSSRKEHYGLDNSEQAKEHNHE
jgi:hypothetical protein